MQLQDLLNVLKVYFKDLSNYELTEEIKKTADFLYENANQGKDIDMDKAFMLVINTLKLIENNLNREKSLEEFLLLKSGKVISESLENDFSGLKIDIDISIKEAEERWDKIEEERKQKGKFTDQINIENPNGYLILEEFFPEEAVGIFEINHTQLYDVIETFPEITNSLVFDENRIINEALPQFGETIFEINNEGKLIINFSQPESELIDMLNFANTNVVCIDAGILSVVKDMDNTELSYNNQKLGLAKDIIPQLNYYCITRDNRVFCVIGEMTVKLK
ncbi:MAG: hypothetical protein QXD05_01475 [Candidatus Pacearchaeota archaeon]